MLDLEALVADMQGLAGEVVRSAESTLRRRDAARAQLEAARSLPHLRSAVLGFQEDMALPVAGRDMGCAVAPVPAEDYTVLATDGSQVAPDYHHIAPWYVINSGCAVLRYGEPPGRERCRLSSHPTLLPPQRAREPIPDADDEGGTQDARAAAASVGGRVEVDRLEGELKLALRILEEEADPGRSVLLLDGPLVQWRMITHIPSPADRERVIGVFRKLLDRARETATPIAGYISRSRAVEWVTLLRFSLCPEVAAQGRLCEACRKSLLGRYGEPPPGAHHAPLAGLRDIDLVRTLLDGQPGWRTEVLELRSTSWKLIAGGEGPAGFFYLNTGPEIARVELPWWVWENEPLMERLHTVLWDQCVSGHGYPMVLSEAHEAAVVRAADRDMFYLLIERVLNEHGLDQATTSAKALSKRRPLA